MFNRIRQADEKSLMGQNHLEENNMWGLWLSKQHWCNEFSVQLHIYMNMKMKILINEILSHQRAVNT